MKYVGDPIKQLAIWLVQSREYTNFTYDLDSTNRQYLAAFVAQITGKSYSEVSGYIAELENDKRLAAHILQVTSNSLLRSFADSSVRYARRLGWYAIVRANRPRVVIETGVDKGLGACVLTAALSRNSEEGYPGYYYGLDINPDAGYLLCGEYQKFGEIVYGDSIETLKSFSEPIDLFINDSDHSAGYEAAEYETISNKLSDDSIVLGDNAHLTTKLLEFADRTGREFLYFQEKPLRHWYPGAGIGAAFKRANAAGEAAAASKREHPGAIRGVVRGL
ncbi:MAG: class I SAM-dependent methyltransferase [Candidatus Binatus sp.]|uniref:class I SAM-dependent methyltransferase n=1 Tax=Candidatus Binatus sp. TaxID=2811406 RepID=UPI0027275BB4|nr:class I SAM-dependent methyltransferase [Candidatus Binatus sp.]MDO8432773.1 class I SAM-dependent methyltransferase [Candidatus Binatus sp.]